MEFRTGASPPTIRRLVSAQLCQSDARINLAYEFEPRWSVGASAGPQAKGKDDRTGREAGAAGGSGPAAGGGEPTEGSRGGGGPTKGTVPVRRARCTPCGRTAAAGEWEEETGEEATGYSILSWVSMVGL
jgi:hypothetical protein